ncbi:MAG: Fe-S-containing hydro-lyase [Clostridiales Family XIII bacterium]|jgi:fumarate hydratase subunit beta|nr:Fe-S-containing hydro-lyase [Clostridiales Family XIII bacterium]
MAEIREIKKIQTPLTDDAANGLKAGDMVSISGVIYTARDAAHKRLVQALSDGAALPFDLEGQIIYYVGPCPAKPGQAIGPCGPTTSFRMDAYTPALLDCGLKGMIGKGQRTEPVTLAMRRNRAVYFAAVGGAAAVISKCVREAEVIAFGDLGPEAIRRLVVEDFPAIVVIDADGTDQYKIGPEAYRK